tara:strand:- start:1568 stop:1990 length:423 start_codon:yes stop_codon:yes gene_type:complete
MEIRNYNPQTDYEAVAALYKSSETFGGQYDGARDAEDRLRILVEQKPDAILVAEDNRKIVGTVTLFEDGRSAWLYRFAVQAENEAEITKLLSKQALSILKQKGHSQALVYAPAKNEHFENRYTSLGFSKGNDFTAYWQDI